MPKFSATNISELMSPLHNAARVVRKEFYAQEGKSFSHVVMCEASDGSWCEFDGEDFDHAKALAANAVDWLGARGCSVWSFYADGELVSPSAYRVYAQ